MAILSREDFLNSVRTRIGEDTSDESITFIEDMTDTYDELARASADATDWEAKYNQLDADWRKRYIDRFNGKTDDDVDDSMDEGGSSDDEYEAPTTYEDLFKRKED